MTDITKNKSKIKIFDIYYKEAPIYKSDIYQPIITSNDCQWCPEGFLRDNTGDNISDRNKNYAELSAHYWVWKNYLENAYEEYLGFCHYRRFLDFNFTKTLKAPYMPIDYKDFDVNKYNSNKVYRLIKNYDIVLPYRQYLNSTILEQYSQFHPIEEISILIDIILNLYPEYYIEAANFLTERSFYMALNFVMKKEILNDYFTWIFNILFELEKKSDWSKYSTYNTIRIPAYLAERFLSVWIVHYAKKHNLKILQCSSVRLFDIEKDEESFNSNMKTYNDTGAIYEYLINHKAQVH